MGTVGLKHFGRAQSVARGSSEPKNISHSRANSEIPVTFVAMEEIAEALEGEVRAGGKCRTARRARAMHLKRVRAGGKSLTTRLAYWLAVMCRPTDSPET